MAVPALLASVVESWSDFYGHHQLVSVTVRYLHLAGILVGGGAALVADRRTLGAGRADEAERARRRVDLAGAHRVVVPALAVVAATGLLMVASDTDTFLHSRLYWSKMGLVGLLLLNGVGLLAAERAIAGERPKRWLWLGLTSAASLVLWLTILFFGVWLTAAA
jgi:uncharacterized membrane protein